LLCALPYRRIEERRVVRTAQLGRETMLRVTFTALGDPPLPFGADRALLAWIQTRAFPDGLVTFMSLRDFFDAFGLDTGGRNYRRFTERLERLKHLSVTVAIESEDEEILVNTTPIKAAYTPKSTGEMRKRIASEDAGQVLMVPVRYGFRLDPDFWRYLQNNPVPMPLPLMRAFHDEPKAWDFTQLVLWRCFAARQTSRVPWQGLVDQLGTEDKNPKQIKYTLGKILKRIKVIYPDLPAEFLPAYEGLEVGPWRPPNDFSRLERSEAGG
jgi:hypothetical protein